ncbi:MAG: hypothetical protein ABJA20_02245, partial [Novosphingobium sp.]
MTVRLHAGAIARKAQHFLALERQFLAVFEQFALLNCHEMPILIAHKISWRGLAMKWISLLALALIAAPAHAEKLTMDHRLHPRLHTVMEANREGSIYFEDATPKYILDRIVVQGNSAQDWREALEIWVMPRDKKLRTATDWYVPYRQQESADCPGKWSDVARDDVSVTFARSYSNCPAGSGQMSGIYRIVLGKKTVYML